MEVTAALLDKFETIVLVDSSYCLYRDFFASSHLECNGVKTGHYNGFGRMLLSFYEFNLVEPRLILCCFDSPADIRAKIFPEYKKTEQRKETHKLAPPIHSQVPDFKLMVNAIPNAYCLQWDGYEGDDIIQNIVTRFPGRDYMIFSTDEDLYYLKQHGAEFWQNFNNPINIRQRLEKKYRITVPGLVPYLKVLYGDKSDNIPRIFGLKETKKIIPRWFDQQKITLFTPELQEKREEIIRNYKLVQKIKKKELIMDEKPPEKEKNFQKNLISMCSRLKLWTFLSGLATHKLLSEKVCDKILAKFKSEELDDK